MQMRIVAGATVAVVFVLVLGKEAFVISKYLLFVY